MATTSEEEMRLQEYERDEKFRMMGLLPTPVSFPQSPGMFLTGDLRTQGTLVYRESLLTKTIARGHWSNVGLGYGIGGPLVPISSLCVDDMSFQNYLDPYKLGTFADNPCNAPEPAAKKKVEGEGDRDREEDEGERRKTDSNGLIAKCGASALNAGVSKGAKKSSKVKARKGKTCVRSGDEPFGRPTATKATKTPKAPKATKAWKAWGRGTGRKKELQLDGPTRQSMEFVCRYICMPS